MTVDKFYSNYQRDFRIFIMRDNKEVVLYDTTKTDQDIPSFLLDCEIEKVYPDDINNIDELEL